jgi:hypothetical protein
MQEGGESKERRNQGKRKERMRRGAEPRDHSFIAAKLSKNLTL